MWTPPIPYPRPFPLTSPTLPLTFNSGRKLGISRAVAGAADTPPSPSSSTTSNASSCATKPAFAPLPTRSTLDGDVGAAEDTAGDVCRREFLKAAGEEDPRGVAPVAFVETGEGSAEVLMTRVEDVRDDDGGDRDGGIEVAEPSTRKVRSCTSVDMATFRNPALKRKWRRRRGGKEHFNAN